MYTRKRREVYENFSNPVPFYAPYMRGRHLARGEYFDELSEIRRESLKKVRHISGAQKREYNCMKLLNNIFNVLSKNKETVK